MNGSRFGPETQVLASKIVDGLITVIQRRGAIPETLENVKKGEKKSKPFSKQSRDVRFSKYFNA